MRPRDRVSSFSKAFCLFALVLVPSVTLAEPTRRQTNIVCQAAFPRAKREDLATRLRAITGWADLEFDKNGSLQLGINTPVGGSETARGLLSAALTNESILILEDASKRKDVVFGKLVRGPSTNTNPGSTPVYVVLIDFTDFDSLIGDRPALAAFDAGWGLLHEIDHAINKSHDSSELGRAGDCEDHINRMRRELSLPERSDYFFTYLPHTQQSEFITRFVRLPFDQKDPTSGKQRRFWLMWDAAIVGGLDELKQVAEFRTH